MKSLSVLLSILVILSIWISLACSISPEIAKAILAVPEGQTTATPTATTSLAPSLKSPEVIKSVLESASNQAVTHEIARYILQQYSVSVDPEVARIVFYDYGGNSVGEALFLKDDALIQRNSVDDKGYIYLIYPYSRYNDILAILEKKEAKKTILYINPSYPEWGCIETDEPPANESFLI